MNICQHVSENNWTFYVFVGVFVLCGLFILQLPCGSCQIFLLCFAWRGSDGYTKVSSNWITKSSCFSNLGMFKTMLSRPGKFMEIIKIYDIAHNTYILKNKGYLLESLVSLRIFNIYENFPKRLKKIKVLYWHGWFKLNHQNENSVINYLP